MKNIDLVFVDAETTGLDYTAQVIELAAVRVRWPAFEVMDTYYQRFKPTIPVEDEAAAINGYTPEAWEDAPKFKNAHDRFLYFMNFVAQSRWVGSVPWYDFDKLDRMRAIIDPKLKWALTSRRCIDVGSLGAPLIFAGHGEKGGLDEMCEVLGIKNIDPEHTTWFAKLCGGRLGPHNAMGDVGRTIRVFRRLMTAYTTDAVVSAILRS